MGIVYRCLRWVPLYFWVTFHCYNPRRPGCCRWNWIAHLIVCWTLVGIVHLWHPILRSKMLCTSRSILLSSPSRSPGHLGLSRILPHLLMIWQPSQGFAWSTVSTFHRICWGSWLQDQPELQVLVFLCLYELTSPSVSHEDMAQNHLRNRPFFQNEYLTNQK